ncbi:Pleiotropic drug resistance protein ABC Superfamily, partial [Phytophthora palmivora]
PLTVTRELGLTRCQGTIVGDERIRGVSGGEKKRVTTGEMAFGPHAVSLMDEITTGLDSSAAFDIVNAQRRLAKQQRQTVVISLQQPAPEVLALFDNVLLLADGEVLYHGPRVHIQAYFEALGFVCPPGRDLADFLCDLASPQQIQYERPHAPMPGRRRHPRSANEFADLWIMSPMYEAMIEELDPFRQNYMRSTCTVVKRQMRLFVRNKVFFVGRLLLDLLVGLMVGSVYYGMDLADAQVTLGVIFSCALFLGLGQSATLAPFFDAREVFYKQRDSNFYRTSSYVLACCTSQIPLAIAESLVFSSLVYWMGGFVATVEHFLVFVLYMLLTVLVFVGEYFFLSTACSTLHVAQPVSTLALLFFILFAGFAVSREQLPSAMRWIYWSNPLAWTTRGILVSQYRSSELDVCEYGGVDYCNMYQGKTLGEYSLGLYDVPDDPKWIMLGIVFLATVYVVSMFLSYVMLEHCRHESTPALATPLPASFSDTVIPTPRQRKESRELLKGVTGYAVPGTMTALMGSTGAGKTTLMDVLAGRKSVKAGNKKNGAPTLRGRVLLNGVDATELAVRRCTGYCEQTDVHSDASTFREALQFSAYLRQGDRVAPARVEEIVDECLDLLGLNDVAGQLVRGSSSEQLKRLTLGVELAAQPSVLFLDEPTSGLDARAAKALMDGVRKVADSGRTVICTIHQPSTEVFLLFDSLLLLQRGGETVYFGELGRNGETLVNYFQSLGLPRSAPTFNPGDNPATWMLDVIGAEYSRQHYDENIDFAAAYKTSRLKQRLDAKRAAPGVFMPSNRLPPVTFAQRRAASDGLQFMMLIRRFMRLYWRTPFYSFTRMVTALTLGLMFGLVYSGSNDFTTYQGANGAVGLIFFSTCFLGVGAFVHVLPLAFEERGPFYRERASETYSALWYFAASSAVEIPYAATASFIFVSVFYPMAGFSAYGDIAQMVVYWLVLTVHILFQTYLGQFFTFAMPTIELAAVWGALFDSIFLMFMGYNPPVSSIPDGYKWLSMLVPHRYTFEMLTAIVLGDCPDEQLRQISDATTTNTTIDISSWPLGCQPLTAAPAAVANIPLTSYIDEVFGARREDTTRSVAIVVGIVLAMRLATLVVMRVVNHQKR